MPKTDIVEWLKQESEGLSYADGMGDNLQGRLLRLARWRLYEAAVRIEALEEALLDATASLSGAASAYRKYARHSGLPRAKIDPFFTTRSDDFEKAAVRAWLKVRSEQN